jgi:FMNH2-dependent dimethyl sulfone monooxygenase
MTNRHLEMGIFAPTIGRMPPQGDPALFVLSDAEQRVSITYESNRRIAKMLDRAGLEIYFMAQRGGRGFGPNRVWSHALDSFGVAAGIAEATERLRIVSTVYTAFYHPAAVARMGSTLAQISGGRWGLNVVSGWTKGDFEMYGIPFRSHEERYRQTTEFTEVLQKFWTEDGFDYDGEHFQIKGGCCQPLPEQMPPLFNAGSSDAGKDFTAQYCDWYFTGALDPEQLRAEVKDLKARAAAQGRDVRIITYLFCLCRDTEAKVQREVDELMAARDEVAAREMIEGLSGQTLGTAESIFGAGLTVGEIIQGSILGVGSGKLLGTPEQIAAQLAALQEAGLDAAALTFRHYEDDTRFMIERIVPLLEEMGVRAPAA